MAVLRGERVLIRPMTPDDVPRMFAIQAQPRVAPPSESPPWRSSRGRVPEPTSAREKAGFKPVGVMRRYERLPGGEWHDGLLMDLLADEL
jgi:RimJ/RimL family protein N-acetyltransferase